MRLVRFSAFLSLFVFFSLGCASRLPRLNPVEIPTAEFMRGIWHELARLENLQEVTCAATTIELTFVSGEEFILSHFCWHRSFFGPLRYARSRGRVSKGGDNRMRLINLSFAADDIFILSASEDWRVILLGTGDRNYFWVFSRDLDVPKRIVAELVGKAKTFGYDTTATVFAPEILREERTRRDGTVSR